MLSNKPEHALPVLDSSVGLARKVFGIHPEEARHEELLLSAIKTAVPLAGQKLPGGCTERLSDALWGVCLGAHRRTAIRSTIEGKVDTRLAETPAQNAVLNIIQAQGNTPSDMPHAGEELALKVEKQQEQLREAIVTRDTTIRRLNDVLAEKIAQESSTAPSNHPQGNADECTALRKLVAALQRRLATEVGRRERVEQRHEMVCAALSEANTALRAANDCTQQLHAELAAVKAQLSATKDADADSPHTLPINLQGSRLLYVGGRPGQIHRIRAFVEGAQAELLHHDGGLEERKGLLAGMVSCADAVFFPVNCISHDTTGILKRLCRQTGKPYLPLRSASLTSFIAALRRFGRPEPQALAIP
jgi:hypothetical protein